ncbi:hypothetical protein ACFXGT_03630 [Streptomyces sp. NPDC059352]|uniref:hypothetical protein n=1 Tax=Streptomyces sp. NPDC059352 TaxID=3346810 RepID=UPI003674A9CD
MRPIDAPTASPEERALRHAMTEATDTLPPLPDLVPAAVHLGRRRRARARVTKAGGVFGLVTAVALGLAVLNPWPGGREVDLPAAPPGPTVTGTGPGREPVHVEPRPGETFPHARLPADERERLDAFQQQAAVVLDDLLPAAVGTIRPLDNDVRSYRGEPEGLPYSLQFSVRPAADGRPEICRPEPRKHVICHPAKLADGTSAQVTLAPSNTRGALQISLSFRDRGSNVWLSVTPDASAADSVPVSPADLVKLADDDRFRSLVRYADAHPLLGKFGYSNH